jgi:glycosyltransferase involved in cell wall biosynthesis
MDKLAITVVVSVKNEELNLPKCLDKLGDFSQVVVVDSMSTDTTPQIVESFAYKLINFNWDGKFPKKRNWTLINSQLDNDWILFLDADEILTEKFIYEISEVIQTTKHSGFVLNYNNYFMGRQVRYGDKMRKLAFFRKSAGEYERIEEDSWSRLDMEIHEHPVLDGSVGEINSPIIHDDYRGLDHYIAKHNSYSTWEANRYMTFRKDEQKSLTKRQKIKYALISTGFLPVIYFTYSYFIKFGFLDGMSGFYLAKYKSNYFFQIHTKIKEILRK